jgi:hypothetical protein
MPGQQPHTAMTVSMLGQHPPTAIGLSQGLVSQHPPIATGCLHAWSATTHHHGCLHAWPAPTHRHACLHAWLATTHHHYFSLCEEVTSSPRNVFPYGVRVGRRVPAACLLFKQGQGPANNNANNNNNTKILPASPVSTPRDGISRSGLPPSL